MLKTLTFLFIFLQTSTVFSQQQADTLNNALSFIGFSGGININRTPVIEFSFTHTDSEPTYWHELQVGMSYHSQELKTGSIKNIGVNSFGPFIEFGFSPIKSYRNFYTAFRWEVINANWVDIKSRDLVTKNDPFIGTTVYGTLGLRNQTISKRRILFYLKPGVQFYGQNGERFKSLIKQNDYDMNAKLILHFGVSIEFKTKTKS